MIPASFGVSEADTLLLIAISLADETVDVDQQAPCAREFSFEVVGAWGTDHEPVLVGEDQRRYETRGGSNAAEVHPGSV